VCTNLREKDPASCCATKGALAVQKRFKERLKELGLSADIRANQSGCLDACQNGVALVIYPAQIWYGHVTLDDIDEIINQSIIGDGVVERLVIAKTA
jgi:(2Fe-2S) ferredoxin